MIESFHKQPINHLRKNPGLTFALLFIILLDTLINVGSLAQISTNASFLNSSMGALIILFLIVSKKVVSTIQAYLWVRQITEYTASLRNQFLRKTIPPSAKINDIPRLVEVLDILLNAPKILIPTMVYSVYIFVDHPYAFLASMLLIGLMFPLFRWYKFVLFASIRKERFAYNKLTDAISSNKTRLEKGYIEVQRRRVLTNSWIEIVVGGIYFVGTLLITSIPYFFSSNVSFDIYVLHALLLSLVGDAFTEYGYYYEAKIAAKNLEM